MDASRRVVLTGLGAIAPNGPDTESFWESTVNGVSGVREVTSFDASDYPCRVAGEVVDFEPSKFLESRTTRQTTRFVHLGAASAVMALEDAGLPKRAVVPERRAVIFGIACPPIKEVAEHVMAFQKYGFGNSRLHKISAEDNHSITAMVSAITGAKGLSMTITTRCAAGAWQPCPVGQEARWQARPGVDERPGGQRRGDRDGFWGGEEARLGSPRRDSLRSQSARAEVLPQNE